MMADPIGVFVPLPLSDEQHDTLYHTIRSSGDEVALLAIGTPVQSDDCPVAAYLVDDAAEGLRAVLYTARTEGVSPCILQRHHLAKLAIRDAEIARLEKELSGFRNGLSELVAKEVAEVISSLKGSAP